MSLNKPDFEHRQYPPPNSTPSKESKAHSVLREAGSTGVIVTKACRSLVPLLEIKDAQEAL